MPQDFSGKNLRGQSFKGQNLTGANFSGADIRGTNFTGAILVGANFSHARAGLKISLVIALIGLIYFLSGLLGFITTFTGLYTTKVLLPTNTQVLILLPLLVLLVALSAFFIVVIRKKLRFDKNILQTLHGAISVTFSAYGTVAASVSFLLIVITSVTGLIIGSSYDFLKISLAAILIAAFISAYSVGLNLAVAGVVCISNSLYGFLVLIPAILGSIYATKILFLNYNLLVIVLVANVIVCVMGGHGGWQSLKRDEKWLASGSLIIGMAAALGTNFNDANLTNGNFTEAKLKNTNFIETDLTGTCFYLVEKIEFARVNKTYLENHKVLELLVTRTGKEKNFDRLDLRGVNLKGAILDNFSFIGADLSGANLQDADLSRAKLVQTQLDGTDFTGATLTGAYIEDWNITRSTKFNGVRCEFVYTRLPTEDNPDPHRKPDNREEVFGDGEFGDFIQPILDTLDLYHSQKVDPRAMAAAFKQLAQKNPSAELEIVAIERRGEDKILLRAKTAVTADKSELSKEYFINYNQLKALAEQDFKTLIASQESYILRLETMITTTLKRPNFYSEGDIMMPGSSKNESNLDLQGAQFDGSLVNADTLNANQIGGGINNVAQE